MTKYLFEPKKFVVELNNGVMVDCYYANQLIKMEYADRMNVALTNESYFEDGIIHLCPIDFIYLYFWMHQFYSGSDVAVRKFARLFNGSAHFDRVLNAICFAVAHPSEKLKRRPVGEDVYLTGWVLGSDPEFAKLRDERCRALGLPEQS
ncbi:hypothetical protein SI859A1_00089 [Aurantimonas manganoxydans SI85-9A1]|uniref:Uncharacterized protein n=1 Tax=Aurantimonas manganoxydans (strain ATCC BAA-1229 / DSM 21871 / SI85-9A1) TaxID=287752 RepID=Q1YDH8_AURMS|nr:hypothetical protein [Aurantimonas manganoxydans]EAS48319.1 hypothetical protein SI859A1_00089 [Aurantimonas manganoxydans SI85-9A1]